MLINLFRWLDYFEKKRLSQNLSQADLLRQECLLIAAALLTIVVVSVGAVWLVRILLG